MEGIQNKRKSTCTALCLNKPMLLWIMLQEESIVIKSRFYDWQWMQMLQWMLRILVCNVPWPHNTAASLILFVRLCTWVMHQTRNVTLSDSTGLHILLLFSHLFWFPAWILRFPEVWLPAENIYNNKTVSWNGNRDTVTTMQNLIIPKRASDTQWSSLQDCVPWCAGPLR